MMKKYIVSAVFVLFLSTMLSAAKNMAVMPFEIVGNAVTEAEAEGITELYISELVSTGKISIVDRTNFDKILKEMNFQNSDWSNSEKTAKLGQATNAQFISRGKIIKLGSKMYLSSTVIDVATAKVVSSGRKEFEDIDAAFAILSGFAKEVVDRMITYKIGDTGPGGGIVFKIQGSTVYEAEFFPGRADWYNAMQKAFSYKGGGYTDWSLPTIKELKWILEDTYPAYSLGLTRHLPNGGGDMSYWSREEYNETEAMVYYFGNNSCIRTQDKTDDRNIRTCVVRAF